jgi:Methyltransferase FkbM domain
MSILLPFLLCTSHNCLLLIAFSSVSTLSSLLPKAECTNAVNMTLSSRGSATKKQDSRRDSGNYGPLIYVYKKDYVEEMTSFVSSKEKGKRPHFLAHAVKWACNVFFALLAIDLMLYIATHLRHANVPGSLQRTGGLENRPTGQKWRESVTSKCDHPRPNNNPLVIKGKTATPGNCTLSWDEKDLHGSIAAGQNLEDAVVMARFFSGASPLAHLGRGNGIGKSVGGVFLEIGGVDGVTFSHSVSLEYCAGWDGMLIEANPDKVKKVLENRPCSAVIPEGICGAKGSTIRIPNGAGEAVDVPCRPLSNMLNEYGVRRINFFSLDMQGAELSVLETFDFRKVKIDVLIVEIEAMTASQQSRGEQGKAHHESQIEAVRALVKKGGMKRVPSRLDGENPDQRLCARNGKSGTGVYDCIFLSIAGADVFVSDELYEYDTRPWEFGN